MLLLFCSWPFLGLWICSWAKILALFFDKSNNKHFSVSLCFLIKYINVYSWSRTFKIEILIAYLNRRNSVIFFYWPGCLIIICFLFFVCLCLVHNYYYYCWITSALLFTFIACYQYGWGWSSRLKIFPIKFYMTILNV